MPTSACCSASTSGVAMGQSTSTRIRPSSTVTGNVSIGTKAGSVRGFPVRRSNTEPWRGHSTVHASASTSPSIRSPLSCEQRSSTARTSPLQFTTPISRSSHSTTRLAPEGSSSAGQMSTKVRLTGSGFSLAAGYRPWSPAAIWWNRRMMDLIAMGRVGVDLYPEQVGVPLADVRTFAKSLGGSATNVAVAAARLGARSAVITKVGDDPFGPYVRGALQRFGVDPRWVGTHPTLRTPVVFCEIHPPDHFPLLFYREPTAPDMTIEASELDLDAIRAARVFWTTGTGLSADPSREATLTALRARDGGITVHDLDHRPMFWSDESGAGHWARAALRHATVAI